MKTWKLIVVLAALIVVDALFAWFLVTFQSQKNPCRVPVRVPEIVRVRPEGQGGSPLASYFCGKAAFVLGWDEVGEDMFRAADNADFPDANYFLGEARLSLGNAGLALGALEEATCSSRVFVDAEPADALYALAEANMRLEKFYAAEKIFGWAADLKGCSSGFHFMHGFVNMRIGRYEEAAAAFKKAIEIDREWGGDSLADAYYNLATIAVNKRDSKDAVRYLKEVLKLQPSNSAAEFWLIDAYERLATEAVKKKDNLSAISYYRKILELKPESGRTRRTLAELYYRLALSAEEKGEADAAVEYLEKALKFEPSHKHATRLLKKLRRSR